MIIGVQISEKFLSNSATVGFDSRPSTPIMGIKMRYEVEPELEIAKGCRCCSCWEQTGKWLVVDKQSDAEDLVFDSEEEAEEWVKQNA